MNSNTLEFFVKMRDMMSGGLAQVAKNAQKTFKKVEGSLTEAFNKGNQSANTFFSNVSSKLNLVKQQASGLGSTLGKAAGFLGVLGLGVGIAGGVGFGRSSINAAMQFGATQKSFEVLTGNKTIGQNLSNQLNKLQADTILGPEVFKAAQTMLGFGIAQQKVLPTLKMLGDVSMGDSEKLSSLTLAISQVTAAGRLQGQDLLQLINAGWNPLQQMVENKVFPNLMAAKTAMEKGAISAGMVQTALEHATGASGKFNGMMEQIADTSFGKMQILQGQWENLKIDVGNRLMPIASGLIDISSHLLKTLDLSESAPSKLITEKTAIDTLIGSITSLNEGNSTRKVLLNELVHDYPDLFKGINTERIYNSELLARLNDVNSAYNKRIGLAQAAYNADVAKDELAGKQQLADKVLKQIAYFKQHPDEQNGMLSPYKYLSLWQVHQIQTAAPGMFSYFNAGSAAGLQDYYNNILLPQLTKATGNSINTDLNNIFLQAFNLAQNPQGLKDKFGSNTTAMQNFLNLAHQIQRYGGRFHTPGGVGFANAINAAMNPSIATGGNGGGGNNNTTTSDIGRAAASGGPRVININGVKFADKIEIHGENMQDAYAKSETKMQEMYLRILNSGASVQNN